MPSAEDLYRCGKVLFPRRVTHLHAMVTSFGVERQETPAYDWDGRRRGRSRFVLFQYTLSGRGHLVYEGRTYRPAAGEAMLLCIPHAHRYRFIPDASHWEFFWVCLAGREICRLWREFIALRGPVVRLPEERGPARTARLLVEQGLAGGINTPFAASAWAYRLAMELGEYLSDAPDRTPVSPQIRAALVCAQEQFRQPMGVAELAAAAGMSRFHFSRRFAAETGQPPAAHLRSLRLAEAVRLLEQPGAPLPVKQLAGACGFGDVNHFIKTFRESFGTTPARFRTSGMYGGRGATRSARRSRSSGARGRSRGTGR